MSVTKKISVITVLLLLSLTIIFKVYGNKSKESIEGKVYVKILDSMVVNGFDKDTHFKRIGSKLFGSGNFSLVEYTYEGKPIHTYIGTYLGCVDGKKKRDKKIPLRLDSWAYDPIKDEVILWGLDEYFYFYKNGNFIRKEQHKFFKENLNNSVWRNFLAFNQQIVVPFIQAKHYLDFETTTQTPLLAKLAFPNIFISYMGTWDSLFKGRNMAKSGEHVLLCSDTEGRVVFSNAHNSYRIHKITEDNKEIIFGSPYKYISGLTIKNESSEGGKYWNNSIYYEPKNDLLLRTTLSPKNNNGTRQTILQIYKGEVLKNEIILPSSMNALVYVSPDLELWFEDYNKNELQTKIYKTKLIAEP